MSLTAGQRGIKADKLEQELCLCAERGDRLDRVHELIEIERVNVNCTNEYDHTPLRLAAFHGHFIIARLLLENRADVDAASNGGWTALSLVVIRGNVAMAQLLLEHGANVEIKCGKTSPLGWAIFVKNVDMVALLLRFGANTEETLYMGKTYCALFVACWLSTVEIVQLFLDHDDDVDVSTFAPRNDDDPALSPLCQACRRNNLEMAQLLIQHGAPVVFDGVYPNVPLPLNHAVMNGSLELVCFLLDNSRFSGNGNAHLPQVAETNHLLSPALQTAIRRNKLDVAQLLADRGANVHDRPFLWKCANYQWHLESARFLLRAGANVNVADRESGETPLWAAASNGNVELVQEFLKARADVRIHANNGESPLGVAFRHGHKRIVYLLLRTSPHVWSKLEVGLIPASIIIQQLRVQVSHLRAENESLQYQCGQHEKRAPTLSVHNRKLLAENQMLKSHVVAAASDSSSSKASGTAAPEHTM